MSNYAEQIEEKLQKTNRPSILEVNTYLDELLDLAGKAVTEFYEADNSDELERKEKKVENLEEKVEELEEEITPPNLLNYQLKSSFDEIIKSPFINQLKFLELLEKVERLEIKL